MTFDQTKDDSSSESTDPVYLSVHQGHVQTTRIQIVPALWGPIIGHMYHRPQYCLNYASWVDRTEADEALQLVTRMWRNVDSLG